MSSDRSGQATALTSLIPLLPEREDELRGYLRALPRGAGSPLARLPRTHVARWVIIDRLPADPPDPDTLARHYLLFTASVDGDVDSYLRELCRELREEAERIWSACEGFPGVDDERAFASWVKDHHIKTTFFFAAYGQATVGDVRNSLAAREQVLRFALRSQAMTAQERLQAFRSEFPA